MNLGPLGYFYAGFFVAVGWYLGRGLFSATIDMIIKGLDALIRRTR